MKSTSTNAKRSPSIPLRNTGFAGSPARQLLTFIVVLGLAALGTLVANATNILFNGDLDTVGITSQVNPCPIGWVVFSYKAVSGVFYDGGDSETWCSVDQDQPTPDGNDYGFFFKPFQGNQPSGDLLSVYLYQDNPATPGTQYTLSGYPSGQANYCGFFDTNSPPPETLFVIVFMDTNGLTISSNGTDLINAGMLNDGPFSTFLGQITTPTVTAPAGTVTVRAGATMLNAYGTSGNQSWFVDYFDLEAVAPAGSPVITNQPASATVGPGGNVTFNVGISNATGATYQWQLNGLNIANGGGYSGVTSATLTITNVSASDVGHYRVLVENSSGSVFSGDAVLAITSLAINPVFSITGKIGDTYRVDYTTSLASNNWIPLSTNKLTMSPQLIVDPVSALIGQRFYRAIYIQQ